MLHCTVVMHAYSDWLYGFNESTSKNLLVKDAIDVAIAISSVVAFVVTNLNSLVPMLTTTINETVQISEFCLH